MSVGKTVMGVGGTEMGQGLRAGTQDYSEGLRLLPVLQGVG